MVYTSKGKISLECHWWPDDADKCQLYERGCSTVDVRNACGLDVDDLALRDRDAGAGGNLGISGSGLDQRLYAQQDGNYNVTSVTNPSGGVSERYLYDAYGNQTVLNGTATTDRDDTVSGDWSNDTVCGSNGQSDYLMDIGAQGEATAKDAMTSDVSFHNRDLDTGLGRWKSAGPMGYVDGMSRYEYVGSSPVLSLDPMGLEKRRWPINGVVANDRDKAPILIWNDQDGWRTLPAGKQTSKDDDWDYILVKGKCYKVDVNSLSVYDYGIKKNRIRVDSVIDGQEVKPEGEDEFKPKPPENTPPDYTPPPPKK